MHMPLFRWLRRCDRLSIRGFLPIFDRRLGAPVNRQPAKCMHLTRVHPTGESRLPNVLSFPPSRGIAGRWTTAADGTLPQLRQELRHAVFALDLAYVQAWQLVRKIQDPASQERLSTHLSTIGSLLEIARNKVRDI